MKPSPLNRAFVSAFLIKGSESTLDDISNKRVLNHGYTIDRCHKTGKLNLNSAPVFERAKPAAVITEQEAREIWAVYHNP